MFSITVVREMDDNLSCLSIPGTRKTLYLSGNESVDAEDTSTNISINVRKKISPLSLSFTHRYINHNYFICLGKGRILQKPVFR